MKPTDTDTALADGVRASGSVELDPEGGEKKRKQGAGAGPGQGRDRFDRCVESIARAGCVCDAPGGQAPQREIPSTLHARLSHGANAAV